MSRTTTQRQQTSSAASNGNGAAIADAAAQTIAASTPTKRQTAVNAAALAAKALGSEVTRKALLAAVGTTKRSDLVTDAKQPTQRAIERLQKAGLRSLAARILTLADYVDAVSAADASDLVGGNIGTRMGSVSVSAFTMALADASSKADALSMFAAD